MKFILFFSLFVLNSCSQGQTDVCIIDQQKDKRTIVIKIKNSANENYYILNPQLQILTKNGFPIGSEIVSDYGQSRQMDSLICIIYKSDYCNKKELYSKIIKLPKHSITEIEYECDKEFDYEKAEIFVDFPYNEKTNLESKIAKRIKLKSLLTKANLIGNYQYYDEEVK